MCEISKIYKQRWCIHIRSYHAGHWAAGTHAVRQTVGGRYRRVRIVVVTGLSEAKSVSILSPAASAMVMIRLDGGRRLMRSFA